MKRQLSLLSLVLILALPVAACAPAQEGTEGTGAEGEGGLAGRATVEITEVPDVLGTPTVEVTVESGAAETPGAEGSDTSVVGTPTGEASQMEGEGDEVLPPTGLVDANRTSNLIGYQVYNMNNEQIGEVEDLLIDLDHSLVKYAIVGVGGFLNLGEKLIPVPWQALQMQGADTPAEGETDLTSEELQSGLVLNLSTDRLEQAPEIDLDAIRAGNEATEGSDFESLDRDYRSFWESELGAATETSDTGAETETTGIAGAMNVALVSDMLGASVFHGSPTETGVGGESSGATGDEQATDDQQTTTDEGQTTDTDMDAIEEDTFQGENIGEVQDIIVDRATGVVRYVLVAIPADMLGTGSDDQGTTGDQDTSAIQTPGAGVAGTPEVGTVETPVTGSDFGDRLVPIPLRALRWNTQEQHFVLSMTQDLNEAPSFAPDALPSTQESGWDSEISDFWGNESLLNDTDNAGTPDSDNTQDSSSNNQ